MELASTSMTDGAAMGELFALAEPADEGHVTFAGNRNPHLAWSGAPDATRSFIVTCIDIDAPSVGDDVNQEDREVPADLERAEFTHWTLANVPADLTEIEEGTHSAGVTPGGKEADSAPVGVHGLNDYTMWFAEDAELGGAWNGYDGCAPPWNDSIPHRYTFTVYAIDTPRLELDPGFTRDALTAAMEGHVLDAASISVTYTTNPRLR
ncbi:MAG: YbhB/YbcL family Raf kinase inhibitor-like protein [Acidimicrobiia bacterium]|nr:MAG: YbhB/YbcL family Raf kinase inhibitor-like protein [Acidimicrobiia bacterium]